MRTVTLEETKALLAEVIKGKEDFVYTRVEVDAYGITIRKCVNWVEDKGGKREPSCIVGQVFDKLGVLGEVDQVTTAEDEALYLADREVIRIDRDAARLLQVVQDAQDTRYTWGDSVQKGIEYMDKGEEND